MHWLKVTRISSDFNPFGLQFLCSVISTEVRNLCVPRFGRSVGVWKRRAPLAAQMFPSATWLTRKLQYILLSNEAYTYYANELCLTSRMAEN